jgi:hypothetical protein
MILFCIVFAQINMTMDYEHFYGYFFEGGSAMSIVKCAALTNKTDYQSLKIL